MPAACHQVAIRRQKIHLIRCRRVTPAREGMAQLRWGLRGVGVNLLNEIACRNKVPPPTHPDLEPPAVACVGLENQQQCLCKRVGIVAKTRSGAGCAGLSLTVSCA